MADKIEVETTGEFMLVDPTNGAEIEAGVLTTVEQTSFIEQKIADGQLRTSAHIEGRGTPDEGPSADSGAAFLSDAAPAPAPVAASRKGKGK